MPRQYEPREQRLVAEWVAQAFPHAELRTRVPLGAVDPALDDSGLSASELRALGVWRRWADALVIEPHRLHLVEGKIRSQLGALEQLAVYAKLLPLTPELAELRHLPLELHLVWAIPDPIVEALARERGILTHRFRPAWIESYLRALDTRKARPSRVGGLQLALEGEEGEE